MLCLGAFAWRARVGSYAVLGGMAITRVERDRDLILKALKVRLITDLQRDFVERYVEPRR